MLSKVNTIKIQAGVLMLIFLVVPQFSYADWSIGVGVGGQDEHHDHWRDHRDDWRAREREHRFFYYRDHPDYGYRIDYIPEGGYTIWVDGERYFYYDGLYYVREGFDYVLVSPPIGAYVNAIPQEFQPVSINGRIYYANNGIYYILTRHGYRVVPQPVVYAQPAPVIVQQPQQVIVQQAPAPVVSQGTFTVNVPNNAGGYTAVIIRRSGNGYVGPQGEFYAQFPKVSQLKTMYVK